MLSKLVTTSVVLFCIVFAKSDPLKYTNGLIYHGCAKNRIPNLETGGGGTSFQQSIYFRSLDSVTYSEIEDMCTNFLGAEARMLHIETLDEFHEISRSLVGLNITSIWTGIEWNPEANPFQSSVNGVGIGSEWHITWDDGHPNLYSTGAKILLYKDTSNNSRLRTALGSETHFAICEMNLGIKNMTAARLL